MVGARRAILTRLVVASESATSLQTTVTTPSGATAACGASGKYSELDTTCGGPMVPTGETARAVTVAPPSAYVL